MAKRKASSVARSHQSFSISDATLKLIAAEDLYQQVYKPMSLEVKRLQQLQTLQPVKRKWRTIEHVARQEDRRRYNPTKSVAAPRSRRRWQSRLVAYGMGVRFAGPRGVSICAKRAIRRQVLFALSKTGAGSRARKRRRNEWSSVQC